MTPDFNLLKPRVELQMPNDWENNAQILQQNRLANQLAMKKSQDEQQTAMLRKQAVNPQTGQLDRAAYTKSLEAGGYGEQADAQSKLSKDQVIAKLDTGLKLYDYSGHALQQSLGNPQAYPQIKAHLDELFQQAGFDKPQIPEQYDEPGLKTVISNLQPAKEKLAMQIQQYSMSKDNRDFAYKQQNDAANRDVTLSGQAVTMRGQNMVKDNTLAPRPPTELQQFTMNQKTEKLAADKQDAIAGIDDTIDEFKRLKAIQSETSTGPVVGSPAAVSIRKGLPFNLGGGDNLQRLEKGYNTMAVKAIGAFKAGGVSFGQLSNAEGAWIKSTQASLDAGADVNQEVLDQGLKLLERRKERIMNRGPQAEQPINNEQQNNDPFAGFTPEEKALFMQQHGGQ
jgi:hypothetical protein